MDSMIVTEIPATAPDWRIEAQQEVEFKVLPSRSSEPSDNLGLDSCEARVAFQRAFLWFALEQNFELAVTIKFNEVLNEAQRWERLKKFDAFVDHWFIGQHWARTPSEERSLFFAFLEADRTGPGTHAHLLFRRPLIAGGTGPIALRKFLFLSKQWTEQCRRKKICPRGDVIVKRFDGHPYGIAYVLKYQRLTALNRGYVISSEFHRTERAVVVISHTDIHSRCN